MAVTRNSDCFDTARKARIDKKEGALPLPPRTRVRPLWGFLVIRGESKFTKVSIPGFTVIGTEAHDARPESAIVLRAGPGEFQSWVEPNGFRRNEIHGSARHPTVCKPGDRVFFNPARPSWFEVDGEIVGLINERDVAAVESVDPS